MCSDLHSSWGFFFHSSFSFTLCSSHTGLLSILATFSSSVRSVHMLLPLLVTFPHPHFSPDPIFLPRLMLTHVSFLFQTKHHYYSRKTNTDALNQAHGLPVLYLQDDRLFLQIIYYTCYVILICTIMWLLSQSNGSSLRTGTFFMLFLVSLHSHVYSWRNVQYKLKTAYTSMEEQINKLCYVQKTQYYAAVKINELLPYVSTWLNPHDTYIKKMGIKMFIYLESMEECSETTTVITQVNINTKTQDKI